jgi:hypothetical protein
VSITPGICRNVSSTPQKHPAPKVAISFISRSAVQKIGTDLIIITQVGCDRE